MLTVSGRIVLDGWRGETGPATVYVRLLDTGRADASAVTVGSETLYHIHLDSMAEQGIEFRVDAPELDPRARYQVGVLVDVDGDGQTSSGDYINMQSYPVLTRGHPDWVEIRARRFG